MKEQNENKSIDRPQNLKQAVGLYISYLEEKTLFSASTIKSKKSGMNFFSRWAIKENLFEAVLFEAGIKELDAYYLYLDTYRQINGRPLTLNSRRVLIVQTQKFFDWLCLRNYALFNPAAHLEKPRQSKNLSRRILTYKQVQFLLEQPDTQTKIGLRDKAMLELLYCTGIRRAELTNLNVDDVYFDREIIYIRQGKGSKDRLVPVSRRVLEYIEQYINTARKVWVKDKTQTLFLSHRGNKLENSGFGLFVKRYMIRAGIDKMGACHLLRHSMATHMLEGECSLRYVQEMLGHSRISSTQVYTHVAMKKLKEVYHRSHPSALSLTLLAEVPKGKRKRYIPPCSRTRCPKPKQEKKSVFRDHIFKYYQVKRAQGGSEQTYLLKSRHLHELSDWLEEQDCMSLQDVSTSLMDEYVAYLHKRKTVNTQRSLSLTTKIITLNTIIAFFNWLHKSGHIFFNPVSHIQRPRRPRQLPVNTFTPEEACKIIEQPDLSNHNGYRDRAVLELLYATGMRRGEMQTLLLSDIDFDDNTLLIRDGKHKQDRRIPISPRAVIALKKYIELRPEPVEGDYLFFTGHGTMMSGQSLNKLVKHYIRKSKAANAGSFLIFRHTVATQMLENGAELRYIQQFLGHKHIESTQIYTHVSINSLKEAHKKSHPAAMS